MPKIDKPWKDAIIEVLRRVGTSMHYTEIANEIIKSGQRKNVGATPPSTVNVVIHDSIKIEGSASPFVKVGRGEFLLRERASESFAQTSEGGETATEEEKKETGGIIQALGMFWRRDWVDWSSKPKLLGQQQEGADSVNFADQIGVYLLHDGREVMYVGRATEKRLSTRLWDHTRDRLNGRWDRFSWFGLLAVTSDGKLGTAQLNGLTTDAIITTMEALLIEGLEPRQNRKRGDALTTIEYLQVQDPEITKKATKKLLEDVLKQASLS